MARKLLLVALVALAGLFAYNLVATGKPMLFPSASLSPEEQQLQSIEARIQGAKDQMTSAARAAGMGGLDSTADVESAMRELERVEQDIQSLKQRSTSPEIQQRCDRLSAMARSARGER